MPLLYTLLRWAATLIIIGSAAIIIVFWGIS